MKKDFQKWHKRKTDLEEVPKRPFFHEREIWFCYLGVNVGFEQDGNEEEFLRPVVVFKKFNNEIFWGIPLTKLKKKKDKKSEKYYYHFSFIKGVVSSAVISQVRLVDAKRLSRLIGSVSKKDFEEIKKKFKVLSP